MSSKDYATRLMGIEKKKAEEIIASGTVKEMVKGFTVIKKPKKKKYYKIQPVPEAFGSPLPLPTTPR